MAFANLTEEQKKKIEELYTPKDGKAFGVGKIAIHLKIKYSQVEKHLRSAGLWRTPEEAQKVLHSPHEKIE